MAASYNDMMVKDHWQPMRSMQFWMVRSVLQYLNSEIIQWLHNDANRGKQLDTSDEISRYHVLLRDLGRVLNLPGVRWSSTKPTGEQMVWTRDRRSHTYIELSYF